MANYTRTEGANARAQSWDDFAEEQPPQRAGMSGTRGWLPLDSLEEQTYEAGPQLRAMPSAPAAPRRGIFGPRQPQPTRAHPAQQPVSRRSAQTRPTAGQVGAQTKAVAVLLGGALTVLAVYSVVSAAVEWTQVKMDDLQFGRPRTTQIDAFVGHSEAEGVPSHFIAMNLNRRVTVLEMPGGDSAKATTIIGPYLFGSGEDLTPVQVAAQDVNADNKPDLVVSVKNDQLIYVNDGATFKLITPEEHAALLKALPRATTGAGAPGEAGK